MVGGNGHADIFFNLGLLLEDGLYGFNDAGRLVNLLALKHQLLVLSRPVLVSLVVLSQMVDHFFNRKSLALGKWVLSEKVQVLRLICLKEVLVEDGVELVAEHVEVIQVAVAHLVDLLLRLRVKHVSKGERPWQQCLVQTVLEAGSQGRHELSVGHQVVLRDVDLLQVDCRILGI